MGNNSLSQIVSGDVPAHVNSGFSKVSNYLLMSERNAVTPWHIDFSFTSVFYFVLTGDKEFLVVPRNRPNIAAFEEWNALNDPLVHILLKILCYIVMNK